MPWVQPLKKKFLVVLIRRQAWCWELAGNVEPGSGGYHQAEATKLTSYDKKNINQRYLKKKKALQGMYSKSIYI